MEQLFLPHKFIIDFKNNDTMKLLMGILWYRFLFIYKYKLNINW